VQKRGNVPTATTPFEYVSTQPSLRVLSSGIVDE